jgi:hypothetical protein
VTDDDLLAMLRVICDSDERSDPLDSIAVSRRLGWSDSFTASSLGEARARLLIWGMRVGGTPAPRFEDIELTVQGRRLLRTVASMPTREPASNGEPPAGKPGHDD